ncbi:MAG: hypothetical protein ACYTGL_10070 [Planctomycetota bacterium]|jgi:Ca2+-binding RTX toxin-like protein/methionine-rich copper-binding protein CopC
MRLSNWLQNIRSRRNGCSDPGCSIRRRRPRQYVELLEDRSLPAAITGFEPVGPTGSLIESATLSDSITTDSEVDSFTVDLDPGQTISLVVVPDTSLQPSVEILAPDSSSLIVNSSSQAGESLVIQVVPATTTGTYTINVSGAAASTGTYSLDVVLNAGIEPEQFGGSANDTPATSFELASSFISLGGSVSRAAVVASSEPRLGDDFESGMLDGRWTTNSSTTDGRIQVTGTFGAGEGDLALLLDVSEFDTPNLNEATLTVDLSSFTDVTLEFQHAVFNDEESPLPDTFTGSADGDGVAISEDGVTWHTVLNATTPAGWETVSIDLDEAATAAGITLGAEFRVRFQQFDNFPLTIDGRGYDGIRFRTTPAFITEDWYSFELNDGQSASIAVDELSGSGSSIELYDAAQTRLAVGVSADNVEHSINSFVDQTSNASPDTYFVRVIDSAPEYSLVVTTDAAFDLESNDSFETPQWIGTDSAIVGSLDSASGAGLDLLSTFPGPAYSGFIPPDPTIAAGPAQLVTAVNTDIAVYDKATGNQIFAQDMNGPTGFFGSVGATETVFDPWVIFDDDSQRFFVVGIDAVETPDDNDTGALYLAVSTDATPTGSSDAHWHKYKIDFTHDPTPLGLGSGNHFPDYEKVGVNDDAIFVSGNYFAIDSGSGVYAGITAIEKAPLLTGGAANVVYEEFFNGFSVFPLNQFESGSTQYFAEARGGSTIRVHAITDVLGTPTRDTFDLSVPAFDEPIDPPQSGGGVGADSVSSRIMTGVWRDGAAWCAHGITDPALGDGENVARWYEVATNNFPVGTPTLVQSGNVDPGPGIHAWMPAIAVDGGGNMGIGFAIGGSEQFYGAAFTGRLASDPAGTVTTPVNEYVTGLGNYQRTDSIGRNRWGDYTGLSIDPSDDATFWVFNEYAATNNRWATQIGSFQLDPIAESDWFRVDVLAGDSLLIETATPFDGSSHVENQLDPVLELYAPDGSLVATDDNSAADGRNATISHTATLAGSFRVRVVPAATSGDYLLSVTGATAGDLTPTVVDTNPDDGALLNAFPATYRVQFSEPLLLSSVSASDFLINGVAATSFSMSSGNTVDFSIDPTANTGDGTYSVLIPAGSIHDLAGATLNADFTATFDFDGTGPTITATQWNGDVFPADRTFDVGPLTFAATFSEQLFLLSSPRRGPFAPGPDDVLLIEAATAQEFRPDSVTFDSISSSLTVEYLSHLPAGSYTLTLVSGSDSFEDIAGSALDGEPLGAALDGTPTGDGVPGGNYTVSFFVDEVATDANDFTRVMPFGSLISRSSSNTRIIDAADDFDPITFFASAGETVSAIATPAQNVTTTIELVGLSSPASSSMAGEPVFLGPVTVPSDGVYELRLTADELTLLDVDIFLNAAIEAAIGDSADGSELSLDGSLLTLDSGRYAVIGNSAPEAGTASFDLRNAPAEFIDISATGTTLGLGDDDETTITTTVGNLIFPSGPVTIGNNGGIIAGSGHDLSSGNTALPSFAWQTALLPFWDDIDATAGNVYWEERQIDGINALIVQWDNRPQWPDIGNATFQLQLFDNGPVAARFAYQDVDFGDPVYDGGADATIGVQRDVMTFHEFSFETASVANGDVLDFILPLTADADEYTVDLSASTGHSVDIVLTGIDGSDFSQFTTLEFLDPTGAVVATGTTMPLAEQPSGITIGILDVSVPDIGDNLYTVRVASTVFGDYSLTVTDHIAIEVEPNNSTGDAIRNVPSGRSVLGYLDEATDSSDAINVDLTAGDSILIQAVALFDNTQHIPLNSLDASLTVIHPNGFTTIASDDNSLDGRNPTVTFMAPHSGTYRVELAAIAGTGEYLLQIESTPHLLLAVTPTTVAETDGTGAATATLTRTGDLSVPLTAMLSIDDATELSTVSEITFPAASASVEFPLDAVDDAIVDGTQTVTLTAIAPGFVAASAQIDVTDNDVIGFEITQTGGSTTVSESGTTDQFHVILLSQPAGDVVVTLSDIDPTEAMLNTAELTFTPDDWDEPQTVTVTGSDDPVVDGDQTTSATVAIDDARSDASFASVDDQTVTITVTDDENAGLHVNGGPLTVTESGTTDTFDVVLTAQPLTPVVFDIASSDPTESTSAPMLLTFLPDNWDVPQSVTVSGVDDSLIDGTKTSQITVTVDGNLTDDAFDLLPSQTVMVTTQDDDIAGFAVTESDGFTSVSETGTTDSFAVTLTAQPASNVLIAVHLSEQSELVSDRSILIFTPSNWNTPHAVTLTGRNDQFADGDQTTTITLEVLDDFSNAAFHDVTSQTILATTQDDEIADFIVTESGDDTTTDEAGNRDTFSLVLTAQPQSEVRLTISSDDSSEITTSTLLVSFDASNWNRPQAVTVQSVDDPTVDGTQQVTLTVAVDPATSDDAFDLVLSRTLAVTSLDDDIAGFQVNETQTDTRVDEFGSTDDITVVLTAQPVSTVVLDIASDDDSEVTVAPTSLIFTPADWDIPQTIISTGVDDHLVDGLQMTQVSVRVIASESDDAFDGLASQSVSVTTTDNDVAGFTVVETDGETSVNESGRTDSFSIVLTAQPTETVFLDLSSNDSAQLSLSESVLTFDSDNWDVPQSVTVAAIDDDAVDGDLTVTVFVSVDADLTDPVFQSLPDESLTVTVTDNDAAGFLVESATSPLTVSEKETSADFTVALTSQPVTDVVFGLSVSDTTEVAINSSTLTFTPQNWNTPQTITVTGVDDDDDDGDQSSVVSITVRAAESDAAFAGLPAQTIDVRTLDFEGVRLFVTLENQTDISVFADESGHLTWQLSGDGLADITLTGAAIGEDILTSDVRGIRISGSDAANSVDLSGVTTAAFSRLEGVEIRVDAFGGSDSITGSEFGDLLVGGGGGDSITGGPGDDTVLGGAGADQLTGGEGDDRLNGQGGTGDRLTGGPGIDTLDGGNGNDVLDELLSGNVVLSNDNINGIDTLISIERAKITGGSTDQTIDATAFFTPGLTSVTLIGASGDDSLLGSGGSDVLVGSGGSDFLQGNSGRDRLFGGSGADLLIGGEGNDLLKGQGGSGDRLSGGAGNDTLNGGRGVDRLFESADTDFVLTNSSLTGTGSDILQALEVAELNGGDSANTIDVSGFIPFRGFVLVRGRGGDDSIIGSSGPDVLNGEDGNDTLTGGGGSDTLNGDRGHDGLAGGADNDLLAGGNGFDILIGGSGDDELQGNDGRDTLIGGQGLDTLTGGGGADTLTRGDGTAEEAADPVDDPTEVDDFFVLNPVPDWAGEI